MVFGLCSKKRGGALRQHRRADTIVKEIKDAVSF